jgi:hypothetical protein
MLTHSGPISNRPCLGLGSPANTLPVTAATVRAPCLELAFPEAAAYEGPRGNGMGSIVSPCALLEPLDQILLGDALVVGLYSLFLLAIACVILDIPKLTRQISS